MIKVEDDNSIKNESDLKETLKKECVICKKIYDAETQSQYHCSEECKSKLQKRHCNACDVEFYHKKSASNYCSDNCKKARCITCNNIFIWKTTPNQKCCSKTCKRIHETHKCSYCEETFQSANIGAKYCSQDCRTSHSRVKKKSVLCRECKRIISYAKDHWAPDFCSTQCSVDYMEKASLKKMDKKIKKSDIFGIVSQRVKILLHRKLEHISSMEMGLDYNLISGFDDTLKEKVKERDEYYCQVCESDYDLEVHHILPQRMNGSHEMDNLITLCIKCHRAIETADESYATKKCVENAELNFGHKKEKNERKQDKIDFTFAVIEDLNRVFNLTNEEESKEEVMMAVDSLISYVEEWRRQ